MSSSSHTTLNDIYHSVVPTDYLEEGGWYTGIVISAPHGGGSKPVSIPNRKYGVLLQDTYTRRLTRAVIDLFPKATSPRYLISNIHRIKVDFNRDIEEGAQGNKSAERLWTDWNTRLTLSINSSLHRNRKVLYVDIHSHNDSDKFELGYNLSAKSYLELRKTGKTSHSTSIDSLDHDVYDMIFGPNSVKTSLEMFGYDVFEPTGKEVYFNGGRNIEKFNGNGTGAIQIEVPVSVAKRDFDKCASVLKYAISNFSKAFVRK